MIRILTAVTAVVTLALAVAATGLGATKLLENTALFGVPSPPPTVRGVNGAGVAWVVADGTMAKVSVDGDLKVVVHGLLFAPGTPNAGTRGGVAMVKATVVCADGSLVDSAPVPLSLDGDALVREQVALPAGCADPIVMVRSLGGNWFARTPG